MIALKPEQIVIPENRFRREFDEKKMKELRESILRNGLLHPLTVEISGDQYVLRAGERRFRALSAIINENLPFRMGTQTFDGGTMPAIEWGELSELQRLEVEVEENVTRADFTWDERSRAIAALHKLRKTQNPEQTVRDTASEVLGKPSVGGAQQPVADALLIAKHLHIPEVAKAGSAKEALKRIKKIAEAGHRVKLAAAAVASSTPHTLIKGDAVEYLKNLGDNTFDVILSDPPYGVDADQFGDMASTGHDYKDSYKHWKELFSTIPDELYRIAKERAHCYLFCDQRRFEELKTLMVLANWTVFDTMMIWDKSPAGMLPLPNHGPRRTYECILYARKGDKPTLLVKPDIIKIPAVKKLMHGAQKPVALYEDLLSRSANPGDRVLDFCGGSGPILVAANRKRLVATYIEREDDAYNVARLRVDQRDIDDGAEEEDGLEDIVL